MKDDGGYPHYFADCRGSISAIVPEGESSRPEMISTVGK